MLMIKRYWIDGEKKSILNRICFLPFFFSFFFKGCFEGNPIPRSIVSATSFYTPREIKRGRVINLACLINRGSDGLYYYRRVNITFIGW